MPTSYIACEGQHDAALLGRLLAAGGFAPITTRKQVRQGPFAQFVPERYPDTLIGRPSEPHFWLRENHAIAVHPVGGDGALPAALGLLLDQVIGPLNQIAVILDADTTAPATRMTELWVEIAAKNSAPGFVFPQVPGTVSSGSPRCGVYVLPDNTNPGSVEILLEACARSSYPDLLENADQYLVRIDRSRLTRDEQTRLVRGTNLSKARLGAIGAVLRPGAAIQNTIRDDRWVDATAAALPLIANLRAFLRTLLGEPTI